MSEATLFDVLKTPEALVRFLPIRVVLRKGEDGTLKGLTEESFSMGWEGKYVRVWWSGKAYSMLGEHDLSGIDDATHNAEEGDLIIDPLAEDSPIQVDWNSWLSATSKYYSRNAPFKIKEII
jgi:hypothetical protein